MCRLSTGNFFSSCEPTLLLFWSIASSVPIAANVAGISLIQRSVSQRVRNTLTKSGKGGEIFTVGKRPLEKCGPRFGAISGDRASRTWRSARSASASARSHFSLGQGHMFSSRRLTCAPRKPAYGPPASARSFSAISRVHIAARAEGIDDVELLSVLSLGLATGN